MNSSIEKYVSPIHQETEKSIFFTDTYAEEGKIPALMGFGLALITWNREAGEAVRKSLQQFHNQFKNIQIIDLGQLLSNDTDALQSLCQDVKHSRILPVFIGLELQHITQLAGRFSWNVYHVANRITQAPETVDVSMSHISYQRHFSRLEEIYHIEEHSFNSLSLGKMRTFPTLLEPVLRDAQMLHIDLNGQRWHARAVGCRGSAHAVQWHVQLQGSENFELWLTDQSHSAPSTGASVQAAQSLRAPFNGKLIALHVQEGQPVQQGDAVLVIESMKLEHILCAPRDAVVHSLSASVGQQVGPGQVLVQWKDAV